MRNAPMRMISGIVTDSALVPLPFTNIINTTHRTGTAADIDGKFCIQAADTDTLLVRFVGYYDQKVVAQTDVLEIRMKPLPMISCEPMPVLRIKKREQTPTRKVTRRELRRSKK